MSRRFLTAEWRNLVMLNYVVEPALLRSLVPRGVELDTHEGKTFISIVGFLFLQTRVLGLPIPLHRNFEEVNLRLYVRRKAADGWRRGVVFIKEVVPRWAIAFVARRFYNENYEAWPMRSRVQLPDAPNGVRGHVEYRWGPPERMHSLSADFVGTPLLTTPGSEEEFITEHYWGYVPQRDGSTLEYRVEHPPWRVWRATQAGLECDACGFYGSQYGETLAAVPSSAFVAEGSQVAVYKGEGIPR